MNRRHILKRTIAAMSLAAIFDLSAVPAFAEPTPFELVIADKDANEAFLRFPVSPGDEFTLSWVHSVEEEAWDETFRITYDGSIEIDSTRFKTYGAGVPSQGAETTRIEDGWVVMEGIGRIVDPLAVLATPRQSYRVRWNDKDYDLTPDGKARVLTFRVEDR